MNRAAGRSRWIAMAVAASVLSVLLVIVALGVFDDPPRREARAAGPMPFELVAASADEAFPRPPPAWQFEFPADHGAHAEYRTEWWYLSGTLTEAGSEDAGRLGVQWLLVRVGLRADGRQTEPTVQNESAWSTSQVYAALFSISEPFGKGLRTGSRMSRGALGLAGAAGGPVRVWVEDWRLTGVGDAGAPEIFEMRTDTEGLELELELEAAKQTLTARDAAAPGERPATPGSGPAAPFQFYTLPRMTARGTLTADGRRIDVAGRLSMEHAWGELPLPGGPVGNDRFWLHLDDGRDVILLRTHRTRAGGDDVRAAVTGLLAAPDGAVVPLADGDVTLEPTGRWTSPDTGTRYPIRWRLQIPGSSVDVELEPHVEDQEGEEWLPFWAGPVRVGGGAAGTGFVQLSGYSGR